ncbi:MAG: histidine triad nucleotide-binding protein [Candidatus Portnoybacteria bacterium CG03_land_8_20_14_0_80_41_10]|uniref:Histidine triad nucleotide-binding protein n=1 Tax=Candidatus Portnoybacteria bacterium CG03_land_8_20_14_0_80_41_10 TaxID=1974808 RepID=A0A2M7BUD6_9BACT|nr:MAG: histidine triad nucleotide-binding protein [Candidatus Portnoybacteria bacterium CG03_land_8_20_14_0_80_41_10]
MCLFCQFVKGEKKAEVVYQDEKVFAFKDINPLAPVHILIIPKKHISSIAEIEKGDTELLGKMILAAKKIADDFGLSEKGYKLLFRVKEYGGQVIEHIHLHLIGGAPLYEDIHPLTEGDELEK